MLNHQVVFYCWNYHPFPIHTPGTIKLLFFFFCCELMCAEIYIKPQGILRITKLLLQKTTKPHMHITLPTAFVHHPPGYPSLMKRGRERPSYAVWVGSSVRVSACNSTPKGHGFCHSWHFYNRALVKGSQVDFTCPIHSLLFISSHLYRSHIPWLLKLTSYPYSSFQAFPNW